ncbi:hypothetical protein COCOBI_11-0060 [Coccomyxa sp. Obi]|nr:hypothetical protein COCOBI_11-0060 [Coccomyxa sp. Obi]
MASITSNIMELTLIGGTEHPIQDLALREELVKMRRKDQERHHSKQIFTKQAHGGPYAKVRIVTRNLAVII